ncbi:hypothetical protein [Sphingomonas sp.]|uniref:hypothetical protein n=1 Tax=Sphingomonas sp. TaxID=28214 RepID=UPI001B2E662E|nr:hypothetical protein [Sphingomonas sp.]MBO9714230.1 hypothetical protein [Sphingomonas sp.]
MRKSLVLTGLLLAGCGGHGGGNESAEAPGAAATAAAAANPSTASCADKPEFVPVIAGAALVNCASGDVDATGRHSGMLVYTTQATPGAVLAWSKAEAGKAGLGLKMDMETMISAGDGDRTLAVFTTPEQPRGARVTVNWGVKQR